MNMITGTVTDIVAGNGGGRGREREGGREGERERGREGERT